MIGARLRSRLHQGSGHLTRPVPRHAHLENRSDCAGPVSTLMRWMMDCGLSTGPDRLTRRAPFLVSFFTLVTQHHNPCEQGQGYGMFCGTHQLTATARDPDTFVRFGANFQNAVRATGTGLFHDRYLRHAYQPSKNQSHASVVGSSPYRLSCIDSTNFGHAATCLSGGSFV